MPHRIVKRIKATINLLRRERKVQLRAEQQLDSQTRVHILESRVRSLNRSRRLWFWAFIAVSCIALSFWNQYAKEHQVRLSETRELMSQQAMRQEFRELFSDIRDNVRTMPLWAVGMWKGWRNEEVKAGHLEWQRNQADNQLQQCWAQYEGIKGSLDALKYEVEKKNQRIQQLESNTWAGQVGAKSRE